MAKEKDKKTLEFNWGTKTKRTTRNSKYLSTKSLNVN
jgi:hypothetical protein